MPQVFQHVSPYQFVHLGQHTLAHVDLLEQCNQLVNTHDVHRFPSQFDSAIYLEPTTGLACCAIDGQHQVVAFVLGRQCLDTLAIHDVFVCPEHRQRGLAFGLLMYVKKLAQQRQVVRWELEVRCSNQAALALYRACGMKQVGLRPAYYRHPQEDAFLLTGSFNGL